MLRKIKRGALLILSIVLLLGCSGDSDEDKNLKLDTILNYVGGVVIDKYSLHSSNNGILTLRLKNDSTLSYSVKKIKVVYSEFGNVSIGDTVRETSTKISLKYYNSISRRITSISNFIGSVVLEKEIDKNTFTEPVYYLSVKFKDGNFWEVKRILVLESEFNSLNIGDTITNEYIRNK